MRDPAFGQNIEYFSATSSSICHDTAGFALAVSFVGQGNGPGHCVSLVRSLTSLVWGVYHYIKIS